MLYSRKRNYDLFFVEMDDGKRFFGNEDVFCLELFSICEKNRNIDSCIYFFSSINNIQ